MTKKILLTMVVVLLTLTGCNSIQSKKGKETSKKEQVVALLKALETGESEPIGIINSEKYIQHNLAIPDGLAGFGEFVSSLPANSIKANTVRVFEDGDYVFAQTDYEFFGPKVGFDVFRFENGKIVEHWDNLGEKKGPNPSGHTQLDGATEVTDLDKTEENKTLVKGFIEDVLMGKNPAKITDYISTEKYIQHNTDIADGLDGLGAALQAMAEAGITMVYTENHKILGEGNFVLSMSEGKFAGVHVAFYDLFRVENGKIVEHWDVIQEILSEDKWANDNGKF
ncbi:MULTISPECIES: nuclear transport factor 2 family protein [Psychrilyobacter]|uniref:SnoaL-like domain-containing protein n=1 Tax=Psychrilyobacter piezotolerans TaxID=2293438 RepID=A0ABX9KFZ8_9FUSO|nr:MULTISPECIES: nuclear transport factor 2 family protein [Psychrilyobacter]MCS5422847.1 nuclear transport factor 2 family protein [Psychrilyobacter sp. S5]NDI78434.1 hypothetical protein [Psychrilyobacter piezotolerans]RDE60619.1 hypothetical protein DV867_10325 [Psychrilyobacter sp. S5]REI40546.1 hypothetical protein DYH56_10325 [Psychrilyobacter piezotolerans]